MSTPLPEGMRPSDLAILRRCVARSVLTDAEAEAAPIYIVDFGEGEQPFERLARLGLVVGRDVSPTFHRYVPTDAGRALAESEAR